MVGYSAVSIGGATVAADQLGLQNLSAVTGIQQLYVATTYQMVATQVSSLIPSFPAGTLALAVVVLDGVQRVQQVIDMRTSYLSSAPDLGSGMKESVGDATLRINFDSNYAVPRTYSLSQTIPADLAIPCSGFLLGAGSVTLSGNTITTPSTYITSTTKPATPNPIYQFYGALAPGFTQGYISPSTGALTTRQTQSSGVFPANCLPLFEATVDGANLIRSLVDWRPSFI